MVRTVLIAGVGDKTVRRALDQFVDVQVADEIVGIQFGDRTDFCCDALGDLLAERLFGGFVRHGRLLGLLGIVGGYLPCRLIAEEYVAENDRQLKCDDHCEDHKEDRKP